MISAGGVSSLRRRLMCAEFKSCKLEVFRFQNHWTAAKRSPFKKSIWMITVDGNVSLNHLSNRAVYGQISAGQNSLGTAGFLICTIFLSFPFRVQMIERQSHREPTTADSTTAIHRSSKPSIQPGPDQKCVVLWVVGFPVRTCRIVNRLGWTQVKPRLPSAWP